MRKSPERQAEMGPVFDVTAKTARRSAANGSVRC